jgi:ribosomal protein RSM22 (predicted rRNA methylase)
VSERRAAIDQAGLRLRQALSRTIRSGETLTANAAALSAAYRADPGHKAQRRPVRDAATADAYAASRMPATFAACARSIAEAADRLPDFRPASLLDVGAGTGAAAWAATAVWPGLTELTLVDREPAAVDLGRRLAAASGHPALSAAEWRLESLDGNPRSSPADLVTAAYVLGELEPGDVAEAVVTMWAATSGVLILVEPGSTAGFERIRAARTALIAAGGHVVAPCPGDEPCPIAGSAWCHFLARLDRSPLQRGAKAAARSWEDEPFSYVAVSRIGGSPEPRVVLGRPRQRPGMIELRICVDGRIDERTLSRRDGPAWRTARDLAWGDPVPGDVLEAGR